MPSPRRQAPSRPCAGPSLLLPAARPCERPGIGSRAPRSSALQGPVRATTSGVRLQRRTNLTAATASTKATCRWPSRRSISKGLPAPGAGLGCAVAAASAASPSANVTAWWLHRQRHGPPSEGLRPRGMVAQAPLALSTCQRKRGAEEDESLS